MQMAMQFIFDGRLIFIPQRSESNGVARRFSEFEQSGPGFFRGCNIGWIISEWRRRRLTNSQRIGGVSDEGMSGVMARTEVAEGGLRGGSGASRMRAFSVNSVPGNSH
jgi:hypothetical protein